MNSAEPVWILNPIITQYDKKYIWGLNTQSMKIFMDLCSRRLYIDGFVDEEKEGISFFHKPVCSIKDCEQKNAILLTHDVERKDINSKICSEIFILNKKIYKRKVIIYGAGIIGEHICSLLQEKEIEVIGFIDSDKNKIGKKVRDREVYNKDILYMLPHDIVVIEAGKGAAEIDYIIRTTNDRLTRFYVYDWPFTSSKIWVDWSENITLGLSGIMALSEYYEKNNVKELILYGNNIHLAEKYVELYECLGFDRVSIMTDKKEKADEKIPMIDEILYKNDYLILLYETDERCFLEKLRELGCEEECGYVNFAYSPGFYNRKSMLDVNLGYTYKMNSEYPGIYIYGGNQKEDYKIAILGGSTTDSLLDRRNRSWVDIMYKEYCEKNITLFNGAVSGYDSAQEIIKLHRDIMKLKPDMVIVYDGFNDVLHNLKNEFWYLESLVKFAGKHIKCFDMYIEDEKVWKGIQPHTNAVDEWLENIQYMNAIANGYNVKFFSFIQPIIFSKKNFNKHSDGLLQMLKHIYSQDLINGVIQFRKRAKEIECMYSYITDLSHIFDDVDVYLDICHVYESGNKIIAKHIWDTIKQYVETGI